MPDMAERNHMKHKEKNKKQLLALIAALALLLILTLALVLFLTSHRNNGQTTGNPHSGQIFLYGEEHAVKSLLEKEAEQWSEYYHNNGMRDLFVELPSYTADYLNLWMQSADDEIIGQLYQDREGTAIHTEEVLNFYKQIKSECPETIFHGTDVGHQYDTTGKRYLEFLASSGLTQSEVYRLTQETIEQGKHYYQYQDNVYRENKMTENFIREFDLLENASIMGIYGSAHTETEAMDMFTNTVPCMANQLKQHYGDIVHSENLALLLLQHDAYRIDTINIDGKEYSASYFGKTDLSAFLPDYQFREYWRLEDAYDDFKGNPTTGNVLPYSNYPMKIETGQVFVIEYTKTDGTVTREYHRSDGNTWQDSPVTEEFSL